MLSCVFFFFLRTKRKCQPLRQRHESLQMLSNLFVSLSGAYVQTFYQGNFFFIIWSRVKLVTQTGTCLLAKHISSLENKREYLIILWFKNIKDKVHETNRIECGLTAVFPTAQAQPYRQSVRCRSAGLPCQTPGQVTTQAGLGVWSCPHFVIASVGSQQLHILSEALRESRRLLQASKSQNCPLVPHCAAGLHMPHGRPDSGSPSKGGKCGTWSTQEPALLTLNKEFFFFVPFPHLRDSGTRDGCREQAYISFLDL